MKPACKQSVYQYASTLHCVHGSQVTIKQTAALLRNQYKGRGSLNAHVQDEDHAAHPARSTKDFKQPTCEVKGMSTTAQTSGRQKGAETHLPVPSEQS